VELKEKFFKVPPRCRKGNGRHFLTTRELNGGENYFKSWKGFTKDRTTKKGTKTGIPDGDDRQ